MLDDIEDGEKGKDNVDRDKDGIDDNAGRSSHCESGGVVG